VRRGAAVLAFLVIVMIAGGVLTSNVGLEIPTLIQSDDPNASYFEATPVQATQFVLWVGFVLFNVLGAGVTVMVLLWLGNWGVKSVENLPTRSEREADNDSLPEQAKSS